MAAFYEEEGSLQINGGPPSKGRVAITAAAQFFMTAFPDMVVSLDDISMHGHDAVFKWTLIGTAHRRPWKVTSSAGLLESRLTD